MKNCFFLIGFCILSFALKAQINVSVGLKVGSSMSYMNSSYFKDYINTNSTLTPLESALGGIVAEFKGEEDLNAFQIELLHHRSGARVFEANNDVNKIEINHIQIPFIGKFRMNKYLYLNAGAYLGIIYNATFYDGNNEKSISKRLVDSDKGLILGIESHFDSGLFLDFRYNAGLTNLQLEDNSLTSSKKHFLFNRMVDLSIGYRFR